MRMIQRGDRARLALEAFGEFLSGDFDGHVAAEPRVARFPHFSHTTRADGREDLIRAEFVAHGKRHMQDSAQFTRSEKSRSRIHGTSPAESPHVEGAPRLGCGRY